MPTTESAYEIETVEVGHIAREAVRAVRMSRETFLGVVHKTLEEGYTAIIEAGDEAGEMVHREFPASVAESVLPIAQTIEVFPIMEWVAKRRGCGCLVGEALIAEGLIDRERAASETIIYDSLFDVLKDREDAQALMRFGCNIDRAVQDEIRHVPNVVVIED